MPSIGPTVTSYGYIYSKRAENAKFSIKYLLLKAFIAITSGVYFVHVNIYGFEI